MNRIEANKQLLKMLEKTLSEHPELRFIQALWSLGIIDQETTVGHGCGIILSPVDRFYEEPSETLKRIANVQE